jgi:two-component system CheB/CheR fusion protein
VEAAGLIRQVGEMVLQKVLKHINVWRRRGLNHPVISINISATQLKHADFSRKLLESIKQYQVPTNALTLELTESVLTDNFESMNEILIGIKDSGIAISIDDFGTGYSSMMYLKRLPIHELKIDRSFVDGIDSDNDDLAIATAIIGMAHALGLKLVAEGVESKAQAKLLRNLGCHTAQGFLFHHPLEVEEFEKLFLKEPTLDAKALPFIDGVYNRD